MGLEIIILTTSLQITKELTIPLSLGIVGIFNLLGKAWLPKGLLFHSPCFYGQEILHTGILHKDLT